MKGGLWGEVTFGRGFSILILKSVFGVKGENKFRTRILFALKVLHRLFS